VSNDRNFDERQRLLGLTAEYLLENGVIDLRLRTLGESIGSSHRVLLYYFTSREQLVTLALNEAARISAVRDGELLRPHGTSPAEEELVRVWRRISRAEQLPVIRLFLEVLALAVHDSATYSQFVDAFQTEWLDGYSSYLRGHGLPDADAEGLAAEMIALQRGLQMDLALGGSIEIADRVFAAAARRWSTQIDALAA
jgi:AcrR family transcriptional regulator